jgi:hypothetical protein
MSDETTQQELSPAEQKAMAAKLEFIQMVKFACFEAIKDYFAQAAAFQEQERQAAANLSVQKTILDTSFRK